MTKDEKTAHLHHHLLQLQASTKHDSICFMLQDLVESRTGSTSYNFSGLQNCLEELAAEWPAYSGFPSYPVRPAPHIMTYVDVRQGFWTARRAETLWVGEYGAARQSLLDFLIERTAP